MIVDRSVVGGASRRAVLPWRSALTRPTAPRGVALLALAFVGLVAARARAQDEPIDIDAEESGTASDEATPAEAEGGADAESSAEAKPESDSDSAPAALLAWYGSLESDVGFARYDSEDE